MSLLIIGGTGTLGRQIVLEALTKGYKVRCLVRNFRKANFLKEWGAQLVYGDLSKPETIPPCLKGITAIIDASTNRATEIDSLKNVDWKGKLSLIEAAKAADIKKFIFFSFGAVYPVENSTGGFSNIPLIKLKQSIEIKLKQSNIPYTIFRLTGFYQGLIEQYAIPILENLPIWVANEYTYVAYMDTQDIAKFCLRSLQLPKTTNKTIFLNGLKEWVSSEIISLCEQLAGQSAKIQKIPLTSLQLGSYFFGFFEWGQNISDRLAFVEILNIKNDFSKSIANLINYSPTISRYIKLNDDSLYEQFKIDPAEIVQLDDYFLEYFIRLLKRLRDINFEDVQKQKNLVI